MKLLCEEAASSSEETNTQHRLKQFILHCRKQYGLHIATIVPDGAKSSLWKKFETLANPQYGRRIMHHASLTLIDRFLVERSIILTGRSWSSTGRSKAVTGRSYS
jgi:hypothetical protein